MAVLGTMSSPDGYWRVDVVRERGEQLYRIWYLGGRYRDCRTIGELQRVLHEDADLDVADLVEGVAE
jgi:hypothetical protein